MQMSQIPYSVASKMSKKHARSLASKTAFWPRIFPRQSPASDAQPIPRPTITCKVFDTTLNPDNFGS